MFTDQWHLVNDEYPEHMMNVIPVWDMGITGHGVISGLIDDGLDYEHRDLAPNFVRPFPSISGSSLNHLHSMQLVPTISMTMWTCRNLLGL
jgi:hypothetical protein